MMLEEEEVELKKGALQESLDRNSKSIKSDWAADISEDGLLAYKRKVEDLGVALNKLKRTRTKKLDMSPDNSLSLTLAKNFEGVDFADEDMSLTIDIRDAEIKFDLAKTRFKFLFGKDFI